MTYYKWCNSCNFDNGPDNTNAIAICHQCKMISFDADRYNVSRDIVCAEFLSKPDVTKFNKDPPDQKNSRRFVYTKNLIIEYAKYYDTFSVQLDETIKEQIEEIRVKYLKTTTSANKITDDIWNKSASVDLVALWEKLNQVRRNALQDPEFAKKDDDYRKKREIELLETPMKLSDKKGTIVGIFLNELLSSSTDHDNVIKFICKYYETLSTAAKLLKKLGNKVKPDVEIMWDHYKNKRYKEADEIEKKIKNMIPDITIKDKPKKAKTPNNNNNITTTDDTTPTKKSPKPTKKSQKEPKKSKDPLISKKRNSSKSKKNKDNDQGQTKIIKSNNEPIDNIFSIDPMEPSNSTRIMKNGYYYTGSANDMIKLLHKVGNGLDLRASNKIEDIGLFATKSFIIDQIIAFYPNNDDTSNNLPIRDALNFKKLNTSQYQLEMEDNIKFFRNDNDINCVLQKISFDSYSPQLGITYGPQDYVFIVATSNIKPGEELYIKKYDETELEEYLRKQIKIRVSLKLTIEEESALRASFFNTTTSQNDKKIIDQMLEMVRGK